MTKHKFSFSGTINYHRPVKKEISFNKHSDSFLKFTIKARSFSVYGSARIVVSNCQEFAIQIVHTFLAEIILLIALTVYNIRGIRAVEMDRINTGVK